MVSAKVTVKNPTGLHLRPAGMLCKEALQFQSSIHFKYKESTANAKSGDEIEFVCEGKDEEAALAAVVKLVEDGLGE